jgi:metal-sulfur cluster biosynthetic enzyme
MEVTPEVVRERLAQIIDPELNIDIISLGLIYDVTIRDTQVSTGKDKKIHILMTLTTPGCPLIHVFESRVKEVMEGLPGIDPYRDVYLELTFDPPWIPDMMTPEARAELGF